MLLRLLVQPPWVRFLVIAVLTTFIDAAILLGLRQPFGSIWSNVTLAIVLGVVAGAGYAYPAPGRRAITEAVAGLDQAQCSQAIAAVTRGVVPADQLVRFSAVRLGQAYLAYRGYTSADQLKRKQRWRRVGVACVGAYGILFLAVKMNNRDDTAHPHWLPGLLLLALALLLLVVVQLAALRTRRIERNISLLIGGAVAH